MRIGTAKAIGVILSMIFAGGTMAQARCGVDEVLVKGRVNRTPLKSKVRVQLVYEKGAGESGEATIENGVFSIALEFLTQRRRPVVNGVLEKCGRRPKDVIVTLMESDPQHEVYRVTLDFAKDFVMADASAYRLRSELVLNGAH